MSKRALMLGAILMYLALNLHIYHLGGNFNNGGYLTMPPFHHFCGVAWFNHAHSPTLFCNVDY